MTLAYLENLLYTSDTDCCDAVTSNSATDHSKCFYTTVTFTHSHTFLVCLSIHVDTHSMIHREQFGVQYFAHFDSWTVGAGDRTANPLVSGQPTVSPEPQPQLHVTPLGFCFAFAKVFVHYLKDAT